MQTYVVNKKIIVSLPIFIRANNEKEALLMVESGLGVSFPPDDIESITDRVLYEHSWDVNLVDMDDIPPEVEEEFEEGVNYVEDFDDFFDDFLFEEDFDDYDD